MAAGGKPRRKKDVSKKRRRGSSSDGESLVPPQLPEAFVDRLRDIVPPEIFEAVLQTFSTPRATGLRTNPLRGDADEVLEWADANSLPLQPVAWHPTGFVARFADRQAWTHSEWVDAGKLYVQSLSSQYAAVVLDPRPGQSVLDLAAAPGGKTTHLAALMLNEGMLSAVEPIRNRFFRLQATLQRMGVTHCRTYMTDGRTVGRKTGERFDRVLLDAPCSSEARMSLLRPDSMAVWNPRKIRECSRKQAGLLQSGFDALLPGGQLLYCTCSFAPEENERIVSKLLLDHPGRASLVPLPDVPFATQPGMESFRGESFHPTISHARRILPSDMMDGFFLGLIAKS